MKVLIHVTKEILQASVGCQSNPRSCAIARAVRDIFPEASVVNFAIFPKGTHHFNDKEFMQALIGENVKNVGFPTSLKMYDFIGKFDTCENDDVAKLPETTFEIDIPDWAINMIGDGNIEEVKRIITESKTLELV